MENCIFCKIVKGELPSSKIYENDKMMAFLDINPVNPGHTLIIPKAHFQMMYDTPDDLLCEMFVQVKKMMIVIKRALEADFVSVSVVGIDVPHFHIHLIPRYLSDGLNNFWPTKKYGEGEKEQVLEKIKKHLYQSASTSQL